MNKRTQLVNMVITRLSHLAPLTSRSMFGGYGICQNKVMFSLVSGDKFYLRGNDNLESQFIDSGMEQLVYMNRGLPIQMRYYYVYPSLWENDETFNTLSELSLLAAIEDKEYKENYRSDRLKELPNITLSLERLLWRAGIFDQENLFQVGAVKAFLMIKNIRHNVSTDVLFSLAGAIEGCHAAALTKDFRYSLLDAIK